MRRKIYYSLKLSDVGRYSLTVILQKYGYIYLDESPLK